MRVVHIPPLLPYTKFFSLFVLSALRVMYFLLIMNVWILLQLHGVGRQAIGWWGSRYIFQSYRSRCCSPAGDNTCNIFKLMSLFNLDYRSSTNHRMRSRTWFGRIWDRRRTRTIVSFYGLLWDFVDREESECVSWQLWMSIFVLIYQKKIPFHRIQKNMDVFEGQVTLPEAMAIWTAPVRKKYQIYLYWWVSWR